MRRAQTVYFMRQAGVAKGPIKIGCSTYLPGRLVSLSVWSPVPLEVAASFPGTFRDERAIHWKFRDSHSHHEWFRWSADLEAFVAMVVAGGFDPSSLPNGKRLRASGAGWTTESRLRASYSQRQRHVVKRTGMSPPADFSVTRAIAGSRSDKDAFDAYVADPFAHGCPIQAPWAIALRATPSTDRAAA